MGERGEIFMRVVVAIVTGIILEIWKVFIIFLGIINWFYTLFVGKRMKNLAEMSEIWNTQNYVYIRYIILESNERPFPFNSVAKSISKFKK